ncbi:hypothetical protein SAMN05216327_104375 [Dyadobacter sp. SG02]|uniref:hypothetical protein n=1 Tax=Dyadobacter sp. SG02 TaxID=1855291 RepID=UPI0008CEED29|nr:hypothetical protein [Dyadobacter sp. SG02]SEI88170.1 hypothetical protein SAMN05216327_104375 [Dyadobacter sp. SG02]
MKSYVLAFLLVFCSGHLFGQNVSPKEIVRKSLLTTTGGKKLNSFKLITTFDRPGTIALKNTLRSPMPDLIESIISAAPDSVKEQMATEMKRANETFDQELVAMYERVVEVSLADLSLKRAVSITTGIASASDTSRTVTELDGSKMAGVLLKNPVVMLQYMATDTVELHYTGSAAMENEEQHIIQVKVAGEWIDVMIGKESQLLSQIVIPRVDTDPLIGEGPVHYKDIHVFRDYKKVSRMLLPSAGEETSTSFGMTVRYNLAWSNINEPFPDSIFVREATPEEKAGFNFTNVGNGLFIMELTGQHFGNNRTLVWTNDQAVDLFTGFIYNEVIIDKMRRAFAEKFPGKSIRNIFGAEAISSLTALSGLFDPETKLYFPKGLGFLSEDKLRRYNPKEDSTWRTRLSNGTLHPFETGFEKDGCRAIILNANPNPEYDQWQVCYYLSNQKVIYVNGYLGGAQPGEQNASSWAKKLCEMVDREALPVEKVICPHGMTHDVPLEMSYEKFRRSVRGQ